MRAPATRAAYATKADRCLLRGSTSEPAPTAVRQAKSPRIRLTWPFDPAAIALRQVLQLGLTIPTRVGALHRPRRPRRGGILFRSDSCKEKSVMRSENIPPP